MKPKKLKVLLIIEQCNPEWVSVPLLGYNFYKQISEIADTTLVTHERNEKAIYAKNHQSNRVFYTRENYFCKNYYCFVSDLTTKGRINWPVYNALCYPIYAEFNHQVYHKFKDKVLQGDYDIVHAITPMMPRYPVKIVKACKKTPFLLGPVNGGVPFPKGFKEVARQESAHFNFLRAIGRVLIPGYIETYKKADKILAGSTFTLNMLKEGFDIPDNRISLFYENGISQQFLKFSKVKKANSKINLLFVGRLVPYKGADMAIEAISKLDLPTQHKILLTIVGDGSEKNSLEAQVQELGLGEIVKFAGWVSQEEILDFYKNADIFCFPSVREFGGAVVLEAMACGLPCIVVNNGGIGEYVTEETGFKIEPISREYVTHEFMKKIKLLVEDEQLWKNMSAQSVERVQEFTWEEKAKQIVKIYEEMIAIKKLKPDL